MSLLETQLVSISDYLDGKTTRMFPSGLITYVEDTPDAGVSLAVTDARRYCGTGTDTVGENARVFCKKKAALPTPAMVEEDLNSGK